jgi:hypothetical protein
MRTQITMALLLGALSAVPATGFAATQTKAPAPAVSKNAPTRAVATHATRGVVKSVDASTLVITRSDGDHAAMTFALNASTHREGTIAVGKPVSVRYREDGKTQIATAVRVQPARQQAAHAAPSKR